MGSNREASGERVKDILRKPRLMGGVESERKDHSSYWVSGLGKQVPLGKVGKVHGEEIYLASMMSKVIYSIFECLFDMSSRHLWLVIIFNR